ncbi:DUF2065 domain-containing protein [Thiosulfativibrio zosterae]|uniref:DUF2065 domain-containing protein n=1 Tax=Thiosulfativibrio zosterae TaxID=2675053 RepID=UPI001565DA4F|nr:DUF2065 domain-containing protein [Thiosulfativibrio zosterae]
MDTILISAIALVFIFEGLLPFVFPNFWRKTMSQAILLSEKQLRTMGFISVCIGLGVLFLLT